MTKILLLFAVIVLNTVAFAQTHPDIKVRGEKLSHVQQASVDEIVYLVKSNSHQLIEKINRQRRVEINGKTIDGGKHQAELYTFLGKIFAAVAVIISVIAAVHTSGFHELIFKFSTTDHKVLTVIADINDETGNYKIISIAEH